MQWANLPELHQTPTLDDSDLDCLEEIRGVLSRHGKLARFAVHLGRTPYKNEVVQRWTAAIAESDGFVFVPPEYNFGTSAVLKNAIDWVYPEWNRKAAGFVSYGSAMGARSVQQLRETLIEVQLAPIRSSVHIPVATLWAHYQGGDVDAGLKELEAPAGAMIQDLLWWTAALKTARASAS